MEMDCGGGVGDRIGEVLDPAKSSRSDNSGPHPNGPNGGA